MWYQLTVCIPRTSFTIAFCFSVRLFELIHCVSDFQIIWFLTDVSRFAFRLIKKSFQSQKKKNLRYRRKSGKYSFLGNKWDSDRISGHWNNIKYTVCNLISEWTSKSYFSIAARRDARKYEKADWSENRCSLMSISHDMTLLFHY